MKRLFLIAFLGLFTVTACKKEKFDLPGDSASEEPVFSVRGTIGQQEIDMVAGIDGAYQETSVLILNGIEHFTGKMLKDSKAFTLSVSNGNIGLVPVLSDVIPSTLSFAYPSEVWFSIGHQTLPNSQQIQSVNFSVDGVPSGSSVNVLTPGFHTVCADVVFLDGTSRSICNKLLLGYKDHGEFLVRHNSQAGNNVTNLWLESASTPIAGVKWHVNDQHVSDDLHLVLDSGSGVVSVKAVVAFTNGLVREHIVLVDTDAEGRYFPDMENYKTSIEQTYLNDFKVSVIYQDNTKVFSGHATPDIPGDFIVNSISFFQQKPNGNKVYKVSGTINGQLLDLLSGDLLSSHLQVTFAIELPY